MNLLTSITTKLYFFYRNNKTIQDYEDRAQYNNKIFQVKVCFWSIYFGKSHVLVTNFKKCVSSRLTLDKDIFQSDPLTLKSVFLVFLNLVKICFWYLNVAQNHVFALNFEQYGRKNIFYPALEGLKTSLCLKLSIKNTLFKVKDEKHISPKLMD